MHIGVRILSSREGNLGPMWIPTDFENLDFGIRPDFKQADSGVDFEI
jgi:hypothetical protein